MDVCIKNIDEEDWRHFKAEAAKHGMKAGDFLSKILKDHEESCKSNWEEILYGEKPLKGVLNIEDAKKIRSEFRRGFKFKTIK